MAEPSGSESQKLTLAGVGARLVTKSEKTIAGTALLFSSKSCDAGIPAARGHAHGRHAEYPDGWVLPLLKLSVAHGACSG